MALREINRCLHVEWLWTISLGSLIWWVAVLPMAGGWGWVGFKVPSSPNRSVIQRWQKKASLGQLEWAWILLSVVFLQCVLLATFLCPFANSLLWVADPNWESFKSTTFLVRVCVFCAKHNIKQTPLEAVCLVLHVLLCGDVEWPEGAVKKNALLPMCSGWVSSCGGRDGKEEMCSINTSLTLTNTVRSLHIFNSSRLLPWKGNEDISEQ